MELEELYLKIGDYSDIKRRLGSDRLISKYIVKFPDDPSYQQLLAAWNNGSRSDLFHAAHTLKGVCATLALTKLFQYASALTEQYRAEDAVIPTLETAALIHELQTEYVSVVDKIRQYSSHI